MHIIPGRACAVAALLAAALAVPTHADELTHPNTFTVYSGRISAEETWHDVLLKPYSSNYTDSYLIAGSYMHAYREHLDGTLRMEYEVNVAYNFGEQDHWELNVAPITLRWQRFPVGQPPAHDALRSDSASRTRSTSPKSNTARERYPAVAAVLATGAHRGPARGTLVGRRFACTIARRDGASWASAMAA